MFTGASPGLAASSSPRYRCRPSPCTGLSPARSTTAAPPRPGPLSRRRAQPGHHAGSMETGRPGTVPVFTAIRSPKEEPGSAPAASLQVRRRPSPQPPGHRFHDSRKFPALSTAGGCAPLLAQIRQVRASASVEGRYDTGSSRTPLRSAHQAHTIWQYWPALALSGLLPPLPAPPGTGCPQLQPGRCDGPAVVAFHLHSNQQRLTAHETSTARLRHSRPSRGTFGQRSSW